MQFSIQQLSAAAITLATISATCAWYIKGEQIDVLKEQIALYKVTDEIDLSLLAENAKKSTDILKKQLEKLNSIESLTETVKKQEAEISKLSKLKKEQSSKISKLESQINSLFSSSSVFSLKDDEHIKLFNAEYVLSIKRVQDNDVYYALNNNASLIEPGEFFEIEHEGQACKVFLESFIRRKVANFSMLCKKI